MNRPLFAILIAATALAGCSRLNPGTWLSGGADSPRPQGVAEKASAVQDTRPLVAQVTALEVDRTASGAIVRATALPPTQGWFRPALVNPRMEDGTLTFDFVAEAPTAEQPVGTPATREIIAAAALNGEQAAQRIVVRGATNAISSR
ncbi:hypothetical protein [Falsirhodobacter deserti]|uniref:hypothetical protein n=1 Tax=Falsirhodobacter deserti TaxID=1365611 RepID=UPI000FE38484|nr:hypothetical protein [Falsirhodobacter deserti]